MVVLNTRNKTIENKKFLINLTSEEYEILKILSDNRFHKIDEISKCRNSSNNSVRLIISRYNKKAKNVFIIHNRNRLGYYIDDNLYVR